MRRIFTTLLRYAHPHGPAAFWHTAVGPVRYNYATLDDYYIDLQAKTAYKGPYDAFGIPMIDYFGYIGKQYNPCAVAQWGLGSYQRWTRGEAECQDAFIRAADWLARRLAVDKEGRGFWWYEFDWDAYRLRKPWASAIAQGQGISVLLRAYLVTRQVAYLRAAERACQAMLAPVEEGGLLLREGGNVFLEEAVADRPTAILDGLIFAVFGLRDYCLIFQYDDMASQILKDCIETIRRVLPSYDLGYWSRADLYSKNPPMPASYFYHGLHVAQLRVLADITGDPIFDYYSVRWARMAKSAFCRTRALIKKIVFKVTRY